MASFYHDLWPNKQPLLAALRVAQITIQNRLDLIPDLTGERGAPKLKEAVALPQLAASPAKPPAPALANTKLWPAFVLSGVGK